MKLEQAIQLSPQLAEFLRVVENSGANGIVGDIDNYDQLEGRQLFDQMLQVARDDVRKLLAGSRSSLA